MAPKKKVRHYRKQRTKLYVCVGMLFFLILYVLGVGKSIRVKKDREMLQVSVREEELLFTEDATAGENREKRTDAEEEMRKDEVDMERLRDEVEIVLVNKDNPLPEDYRAELKTLPNGVGRAAKEAYEPLCDMLEAGQEAGLSFIICSSYRDVAYQKKLFEEDVAALMGRGYSYEEAYEEVAKETMPPGYSEHSTGLAFDIVALDYQMLNAGQEKTAENKWLQEHCAEYGFILRYPKGKEDITGINYESWHFRYVGVEAAEYIMEHEITLEEYLTLQKH